MLKLPKDIDMVIHAGDATIQRDKYLNENELRTFFNWFSSLPYKHKLYIPGNHDTSYPANLVLAPENITVLCHNEIEIEGIRFFGSPYTPSFGHGWAYNIDRDKIQNYWNQIPKDTDVIITHGTAKGILDLTRDKNNRELRRCGCDALLDTINELKPKYHIFGHIHDEPGINNAGTLKLAKLETIFVNASIVNYYHESVNPGIIIKI